MSRNCLSANTLRAATAPNSPNAAVLGTGGAARGAAYALLRLGYAVIMMGRSLEPAREFANNHDVHLARLSAEVLVDLDPAVVVQATPVGSVAGDPAERLLADWRPKEGTAVLDMVYQPRYTKFLRDAAAAGAIAIPGSEMFLTQAAAQVELFTGKCLLEAELATFLAGTPVVES